MDTRLKFKTCLMLLSILLCTASVFAQAKKTVKEGKKPAVEVKVEENKNIVSTDVTPEDKSADIIKHLDVGIGGGALFYGDKLGYQGFLDSRFYLMETSFNMSVFTGLGGLYQYTKSELHTMNSGYGYALAGFDYYFIKDILPSLALRMQLAGGGGYTMDTNLMGNKAGKTGYIVYPTVGFDYGFDSVHVSLMYGYEIIGVSGTTMRTSTASLAVGYRIF